ncbi:MAG: hypothetical protein Q9183_006300 [Haloplaca sp. 2 TL-2023]
MSQNLDQDDEEFLIFGDNNTALNFPPTQSSSHPAADAGLNASHANTDAAASHPLFANGGSHHFSTPLPPRAHHLGNNNILPRQPGDLFALPWGSLHNAGTTLPNVTPDPVAANWNLSELYPWAAGLQTSPTGAQNPPVQFTSWAHLPGNSAPWRSLAPRPAHSMENAAATTTNARNDQQDTANGMSSHLEDLLNDPSIVWNSTTGEQQQGANGGSGEAGEEDEDEEEEDDGDDVGFTIDDEILEILDAYVDWDLE